VPNSGMNVITAQRDDWMTPPALFTPLNERFGFTIDAAASSGNHLLPRFWNAEDDAISKDWSGERVFCNPPFSLKGRFAQKAATSDAVVVAMVLPALGLEQKWVHDWVIPYASEIIVLRGRVRFVPPEGVIETSPRFGTMVVVWNGNDNKTCQVTSLRLELPI